MIVTVDSDDFAQYEIGDLVIPAELPVHLLYPTREMTDALAMRPAVAPFIGRILLSSLAGAPHSSVLNWMRSVAFTRRPHP